VPEFLVPSVAVLPSLLDVGIRLVVALLLGAAIAWVYGRARSEPPSSFTATLVLLSVLIALVTQVIGDNVARAFSLVGALSIVRFRTVVRDTQDTAYVIFAVAVGMAVGASSLWVAVLGFVVVSAGAFALKREPVSEERLHERLPFRLEVRLDLGLDANALLRPSLDAYFVAWRVVGASTVKQGTATEVAYLGTLRQEDSVHELVGAINSIDGVRSVTVARASGSAGLESREDRAAGS
jgi:hypothetical protein